MAVATAPSVASAIRRDDQQRLPRRSRECCDAGADEVGEPAHRQRLSGRLTMVEGLVRPGALDGVLPARRALDALEQRARVGHTEVTAKEVVERSEVQRAKWHALEVIRELPLVTVIDLSTMAAESERCIVTGHREPAAFSESEAEALESLERDHSLAARPGPEFETEADAAVRSSLAALRAAMPARVSGEPLRLVESGRTVAEVGLTEFMDGWAVTGYQVEVPLNICQTLAQNKAGE